MPPNAMAFISMKSGIKLQGLINVSGFHVDPGYDGKLVYSVYNAGPSPVHLQEGKMLFLIWYADLDDQCTEYRKKDTGYSEISGEILKNMNREVLSLQSMSEIVNGVKKEMEVQKRLFTWGARILGSILVGLILGMVVLALKEAGSNMWSGADRGSTTLIVPQSNLAEPSSELSAQEPVPSDAAPSK